jgi:hypothetical protein
MKTAAGLCTYSQKEIATFPFTLNAGDENITGQLYRPYDSGISASAEVLQWHCGASIKRTKEWWISDTI